MERAAHRGFTLIELLVTVAIISILAAIAYPSYQSYVRRAQRAQARAVLQEAAQFMERFYTENHAYNQKPDNTAVALPTSLQHSPKDGAAMYQINLLN